MAENIKGNYEGYIWMSDATKPVVYNSNESVDITLDDNANPFVIEGELYDKQNGESISIRFADGHYFVKKFTVKPEDLKGSERVTKKEYLAQRMPGVGRLKYLQYWNEAKDTLCDDMETLQPGDLVFVGYKAEEK